MTTRSAVTAALRRHVVAAFHGRCAYCQTQEDVAGVQFTVDHVVPLSLGGSIDERNACLCCWDCNMAKHDRVAALDPLTGVPVRLFHPVEETWSEHFEWLDGGLIVAGQTATGRATVAALRLNRPLLVRARRSWIRAGWHPPPLGTS